jgi:hypothetical protein
MSYDYILPAHLIGDDTFVTIHLLISNRFKNLMREQLATFQALINGNASIEYIHKRYIKRTPGDTTVVGHN